MKPVFLLGYVFLAVVYGGLLLPHLSYPIVFLMLTLLGAYYAATDESFHGIGEPGVAGPHAYNRLGPIDYRNRISVSIGFHFVWRCLEHVRSAEGCSDLYLLPGSGVVVCLAHCADRGAELKRPCQHQPTRRRCFFYSLRCFV